MSAHKREDIINTAMELIALHGFHGAPMAMIAKRANVAAGTIYRFFESKDELIGEIYSCLEDQMLASVMERYSEALSIRDRFQHVCRELVNYFIISPMAFRFIEQFYNSPYGAINRRERLNDNKCMLSKIFEEGKQQKVVKNLPLPILNALTFGPLIDICRNHILKYFELNDPTITCTVEACWDAVRN